MKFNEALQDCKFYANTLEQADFFHFAHRTHRGVNSIYQKKDTPWSMWALTSKLHSEHLAVRVLKIYSLICCF